MRASHELALLNRVQLLRRHHLGHLHNVGLHWDLHRRQNVQVLHINKYNILINKNKSLTNGFQSFREA